MGEGQPTYWQAIMLLAIGLFSDGLFTYSPKLPRNSMEFFIFGGDYMFTGIIEDQGQISAITKTVDSMQLTIQSQKIASDVALGDSVAVNGVCLTVTHFTTKEMVVDVMPETVKATAIHALKVGQSVNLERAMAANGRFGGHFVSGHVDGVGTIRQKRRVSNAVYIDITISKELSAGCIPRGSITLDGTSLTIFNLQPECVTVSLIPHTYEQTILGKKSIGDLVNVETDLLGKYVLNNLQRTSGGSAISRNFLSEHGF